MRIGLLTFTDGTNLGQRLQNFALQQVIKELVPGCTVVTIRQSYPFSKTKRKVKMCIAFLRNPKHEIIRLRRKKHFDEFNKKHIEFYPKEMLFYGDNTAFSKEFDCFLVGSDQVWNPSSPFVGANFFLTFAKKHQRLTYAPSFSVNEIPAEKENLYKDYLSGFPDITVREDIGATIVNELAGKPADVVLDPTLLLEKREYEKIKVEYRKRPKASYILAVFLGDSPNTDIDEISKKLEQNVFSITPDTVIGPDEFLDIIEHAELVLTDSYHVTIFSIIFRKPFVNFTRSGKGSMMSSRFDTLFRMLGIHNREWSYLRSFPEEIKRMDFEAIYHSLECERIRCISILKKELEPFVLQ